MTDQLPFFLAWLITWLALMVYLWRLEIKLKALERETETRKS